MPTTRFTVLAEPLEQQVAASAAKGWRKFLGLRASLPQINATTADAAATAARAVQASAQSGNVAFFLALLILALLILRQLLIRIETKRILRDHLDGKDKEE